MALSSPLVFMTQPWLRHEGVHQWHEKGYLVAHPGAHTVCSPFPDKGFPKTLLVFSPLHGLPFVALCWKGWIAFCKPGFSLCVWLSPPRAIFTKMLASLMILSAILGTQQLLLFPVPKRKPFPTLRTCQQYLQAMNLWQKKAGVWCLLLHRLPAPWKHWGLAMGTMQTWRCVYQ